MTLLNVSLHVEFFQVSYIKRDQVGTFLPLKSLSLFLLLFVISTSNK
jgi:hypothetical protein